MEADLKFYVQAIITVVLLTDPFVRPMLFKSMTAHEPDKRGAYVRTIMIVVGATLGPPRAAHRESVYSAYSRRNRLLDHRSRSQDPRPDRSRRQASTALRG